MTDKQYREHQAKVKKYWDKWYKILAMYRWRIDRSWARERNEDSPTCIAQTSSNWEYQTGHITFYMPVVMETDDSMLEESIVHEFVHLLLAPIQDMSDDREREITEHTVTSVARSLVWAFEAGERAKK